MKLANHQDDSKTASDPWSVLLLVLYLFLVWLAGKGCMRAGFAPMVRGDGRREAGSLPRATRCAPG